MLSRVPIASMTQAYEFKLCAVNAVSLAAAGFIGFMSWECGRGRRDMIPKKSPYCTTGPESPKDMLLS